MQTFMPYANYKSSLLTLDFSRLGNQIWREGKGLLTSLLVTKRGRWPALEMWRGHERALADYCRIGAMVMDQRGWYRPEVRARWHAYFEDLMFGLPDTGPPAWIGDQAVHDSHKSALMRKNPEWYGQFGWAVPHDLEYVWPKAK